MLREQQDNCSSCASGIQTERNRYFTGKFMTAGDFEKDQNYQVNRHRLHNRLLHGWGIVCGLDVAKHRDPECEKRWVIVQPGTAIDCCGRELFVQSPMPFELPLPLPKGNGPMSQTANPDVMHGPFLLGLTYQEMMIDYVPALYSDNACDPQRQQPNNVREGIQLVCVPLAEVDESCWQAQGARVYAFSLRPEYAGELDKHELSAPLRKHFAEHGWTLSANSTVETEQAGSRWMLVSDDKHFEIRNENHVLNVFTKQRTNCCDDCGEQGDGASCLEPTCPCKGMVPLALVTFDAAHPEYGFHLHFHGRKLLVASGDLLTHIVDINWPHGGDLPLRKLREEMHGQLRIRFDRKLLQSEGLRSGINAMTFVVQYGGVQRDIEYLSSQKGHLPKLDDNECEAVFTIDPDYLGESKDEENIANNWVYITLKCDFILDCHAIPVDGNFLRGQLPTGDGRQGGIFESWFRVE